MRTFYTTFMANENDVTSVLGRPLKFQSVEELNAAIQQYFHSREAHIAKTRIKVAKADGTFYWQEDEELIPARPKTMSGLARALGVHRATLINYKERPEFFDSIAGALAECEEYAEEQLFIGRNANGAAFALRNNYGWTDKREIESFNRNVESVLDALDNDVNVQREELAAAAGQELAQLDSPPAN